MGRLKNAISKIISTVGDKILGNGLMQEENCAEGKKIIMKGAPELLRKVAGECVVLLKNEGNVLPLSGSVALFGRCQTDWFYVGYGSGGDVSAPYKMNLVDGLSPVVELNKKVLGVYTSWLSDKNNAPDHGWWGHWPYNFPEMPLDDTLVKEAAEQSDTAVVVIGRAAGEDRENTLTEGCYYLTETEKDMISKVTAAFEKTVVVLNIGNVIDLNWTQNEKIKAVVLAWQLGQESGNAVSDVLVGKVNPSGKLPDTVALSYEDYPSSKDFGAREYNNYTEDIFVGYRYFETFKKDRVLFPFGYGLSYTEFEISGAEYHLNGEKITINVTVKNIGSVGGKEVVQCYCHQPKGALAKAEKVLVAFKKTALLPPGGEEKVALEFDRYACSSYDDEGVTGFAHAYVLENGGYEFLVGNSVRNVISCGGFSLEKTVLLQQLTEICPVAVAFDALSNVTESGTRRVKRGSVDLAKRIASGLPKEIHLTEDKGIKLSDVAAGRSTLAEFIAQLSDKELEALTRGEGMMNSKQGVSGNGGVFGGVIQSLRDKGIPPIVCDDGPSGLRLKRYASLLPCGTALASGWNPDAVAELMAGAGDEMEMYGVDILLGPGMNIHRNPLCGRNFEYFSEDPLLSGKISVAAVRGVQSKGLSACIKHFACNNQEVNRNKNDSRVSERALREIYLKGFEIAVKEGKPLCLMTSYNKINGVWSHYNYYLATTVLRQEWGYEGLVMTDWWMQYTSSPEFPSINGNAYRVRSQVDVLMPGDKKHVAKKYKSDGSLLPTLGEVGGITRGELQRSAMTVLRLAIKKIQRNSVKKGN